MNESQTGSTDKSSVRITLSIQISDIFFDVDVCLLRVNGRNVEENKYVKVGLFSLLLLFADDIIYL